MTEKPNFRSTGIIQYGIPFTILMFAVLFILVGILPLFGTTDAEGQKLPLGITSFILIGLLLIFVYKIINARFNKIEFYESKIIIARGEIYSWNDVVSLFKLPFIAPPIYRAKFQNRDKAVYFGFKSKFYATLIIYSYDFSGFLKYARTKMVGEH